MRTKINAIGRRVGPRAGVVCQITPTPAREHRRIIAEPPAFTSTVLNHRLRAARFNKRKALRAGPYIAEMPSDRRSLSSDRQQLPVPGHDDRIDDMDNTIRRSDIGLLDVSPIDLHARG